MRRPPFTRPGLGITWTNEWGCILEERKKKRQRKEAVLTTHEAGYIFTSKMGGTHTRHKERKTCIKPGLRAGNFGIDRQRERERAREHKHEHEYVP